MIVTHSWLKEFCPALPDDLPALLGRLGLGVERVEQKGGDVVYSIEVLSNRPDCLSVVGIAREIGAVSLRPPAIPTETDPALKVAVEAPDLCPRYTARTIRGVSVAPSPEHIARRLEAVGVRPVNAVVDATNYVMMERGQPLHAFDADRIRGGIVVRRARKGETIEAIDGKKYTLDPEMLVIADADRPVAIAGVMGGKESEIGPGTKTVILESALFHGPSIRKTSRALGLASPSSYRFERGVSWDGVAEASALATKMIGGNAAEGWADVSVARPASVRVSVTPEQVERVLGMKVSPEALRRWAGAIPDWRRDLRIPEDLIEEIARLEGYEKIPDDVAFPVALPGRAREREVEQRLRELLIRCGAQEVLTDSFTSDPMDALFGADPVRVRWRGVEQGLRRSLVPGLLAVLRTNAAYTEALQPVFELAKAYAGTGERARLAVAAMEPLRRVQGLVEGVVEALAERRPEAEPCDFSYAKSGRGAVLKLEGRALGWVAELASEGCAAELDVEALTACARLERRVGEPARRPSVQRDLAVVVEASAAWRRIEQEVRGAAPANLETVEFFDAYTGRQVPDGKKSVAFRLTFRAAERTLTHDEVDREVARVVQALERALGAVLRA